METTQTATQTAIQSSFIFNKKYYNFVIDDILFSVPGWLVRTSKSLYEMISDSDVDNNEIAIPLTNINPAIFQKILDYSAGYAEKIHDYVHHILNDDWERVHDIKICPHLNNCTDTEPFYCDKCERTFDVRYDLGVMNVKLDGDFFENSRDILIEFSNTCNFLNMKWLLIICAKTIAEDIQPKSVEQIRLDYNIINDMTEDEINDIIEENKLAE